jgi:hypothetical protein
MHAKQLLHTWLSLARAAALSISSPSCDEPGLQCIMKLFFLRASRTSG